MIWQFNVQGAVVYQTTRQQPTVLRHKPFVLEKYADDYGGYLDVERLSAMPGFRDALTSYDAHISVDDNTVLLLVSSNWCTGQNAVLFCEVNTQRTLSHRFSIL